MLTLLYLIITRVAKSVLPSSWFNVLRNDGISESAWDEDNFSPPELLLTNVSNQMSEKFERVEIKIDR
jgi:hypothetical protein